MLALLLAVTITAADVPCWQVRLYVRLYGSEAAEKKARDEYGATAADIRSVRRRCQIREIRS